MSMRLLSSSCHKLDIDVCYEYECHISFLLNVLSFPIFTFVSLARDLYFLQNAEGSGLAPFDCWLCLRGIKTLALRVEKQQVLFQIYFLVKKKRKFFHLI